MIVVRVTGASSLPSRDKDTESHLWWVRPPHHSTYSRLLALRQLGHMIDDQINLDDLFPRDSKMSMVFLEAAWESHTAAARMYQESSRLGTNPQKVALYRISARLLINDRNEALDHLVKAWAIRAKPST